MSALRQEESVERQQIDDFVSRLSILDAQQLGFVMALALYWRNQMLLSDIDLLHPIRSLEEIPDLKLKLVEQVNQLQRTGEQSFASGLMVWVHTLRAASLPELVSGGRKMWRELQRVFDHIDAGARSAERVLAKTWVCTDGAGQFPDGFAPERVL